MCRNSALKAKLQQSWLFSLLFWVTPYLLCNREKTILPGELVFFFPWNSFNFSLVFLENLVSYKTGEKTTVYFTAKLFTLVAFRLHVKLQKSKLYVKFILTDWLTSTLLIQPWRFKPQQLQSATKLHNSFYWSHFCALQLPVTNFNVQGLAAITAAKPPSKNYFFFQTTLPIAWRKNSWQQTFAQREKFWDGKNNDFGLVW